jgi:hypothetical protein
MDAVEYDLAISVLFLKQSIENFEKVCKPPIPCEVEKKRHRVWVDPFMRKHTNEVKTYRVEEMSRHKQRRPL